MIIKKINSSPNNINRTEYKRRWMSLKQGFFVTLLVGLIISGYWASKIIRTKGYNSLWDFGTTLTSNYFKGLKADPETLSIQIDDKDFNKLEKYRKRALERGVIINDIDGNYVSAVMEYQGEKIDVKLRLKGHMTDHLQDNKWSFRVKTRGNDSFMGMKRFSIQHPGTRGYIYEWIYHELMKQEDIIALRYKFINIIVNGRDWGIYAVEENFENDLIENNNRKRGPILRFNPDMYWVNRYNMMIKQSSTDEYATYYSANPEAYRENKVLEDSIQKKYFLKAVALMEGLRSKQVSVEQAFDVSRLAKFHAVIDLVGGVHSIDWSDIKYYYNPVIGKFEPVAYESFTNLESRDLSAFYKYVQLDSAENYIDWHTMIFSNKVFFAEYVKQLERITQPEYLNKFFNGSNVALNDNLAIIYTEFPYKKFDPALYYKRQAIIKKVLSPPKAIHAYFNNISGNTIHIQAGAIDALPVEIRSITINGTSSLLPDKTFVLPSKQRDTYVKFIDLKFIMPSNFKWKEQLGDSITIQYSILGSSQKMEANVFSFPHTDSEFITADLKNKQSNINEFDFLILNEELKKIFIGKGNHVITKNMVIPAGYCLMGNNEASLDLKNNSGIISYSPIDFRGAADDLMRIGSSDSTGQGIIVIGAASVSVIEYVAFLNLPKMKDEQWARSGALTFYESPVEFKNCSFYKSKAEDAVNIIRSGFLFEGCLFQDIDNDALDIDFSEGVISQCVFETCKENGLDITMSRIKANGIYMKGAGNKAINVKAGSQISATDTKIVDANVAVSAEDTSFADFKNISISDSEIGIAAYKNKPGGGYPKMKLNSLTFINVKKKYLKEKKSSVIANGVEISDDIKDVETIIKSDKRKH